MTTLAATKNRLIEKKNELKQFNLQRNEIIEKLRNAHEYNDLIRVKTRLIQEKSENLELEMLRNSAEFLESIKKNEILLKNLNTQFTSDYLQDAIDKCEKKHKNAKNTETYLTDIHEKSKNLDKISYKTLNLSKLIAPNKKRINIADLEKNIQDSLNHIKIIKGKIHETVLINDSTEMTLANLIRN